MTEELKTEEVVEVVEQPSAEEEKATKDGWMPLDKWVEAGNTDRDHRSAREFNDRGELLRKISEQNKHIQRVNQGMETLKGHNARVFEAAHAKAVEDLKQQHARAIEDGNLAKADQLVDKLTDAKAQMAVAAAQRVQAPQPVPELQEWRERNTWYDSDDDMRAFADVIGERYVQKQKGQVSTQEVLDYVETKVKDRFMKKEEVVRKEAAPNPVATTTNTATKVTPKALPGLKKTELDEFELKAMKDFVQFKLGTEADYLKQLEQVR